MRLTQKIVVVSLLALSSLFWSCDAINPQDGDLVDYSCEGCHTNKTALSGIIADLEELSELPAGDHSAPG